MERAESITLYYREGNSDKVYTANLVPVGLRGDEWSVTFAYGRRGSTMTAGAKVHGASYPAAKRVFDKLVREKTAKGYRPGNGVNTMYQQPTSETRDTGLRPQLLNEVDEAGALKLLQDNDWILQEKFDGKRVMIKKEGQNVTGSNRKGLAIALPAAVVAGCLDVLGDFVIDGEMIGETYVAFDLLSHDYDLRDKPYQIRYEELEGLGFCDPIRLSGCTVTQVDKLQLMKKLKKAGKEGLVFKKRTAPYKAGRPNSGGDQLKHKFWSSGSFIVEGKNDKRSVALAYFKEDGRVLTRVAVGNVTIPPNQEIPDLDDIVEVRYLYAYRGGSLFQPTYIEVRDDLDRSDCTEKQLKYKSGEDEEN